MAGTILEDVWRYSILVWYNAKVTVKSRFPHNMKFLQFWRDISTLYFHLHFSLVTWRASETLESLEIYHLPLRKNEVETPISIGSKQTIQRQQQHSYTIFEPWFETIVGWMSGSGDCAMDKTYLYMYKIHWVLIFPFVLFSILSDSWWNHSTHRINPCIVLMHHSSDPFSPSWTPYWTLHWQCYSNSRL